jgi:hypothetical protein
MALPIGTETASRAGGSECPFGGAAPLYTRITDTEAKCPFGGNQSFSTKETDYQPWKVTMINIDNGLLPDRSVIIIDQRLRRRVGFYGDYSA